jgi:acetamidase/formamidase
VGDTHAAQGNGEVCGTAIESPMDVVLTLDLTKGANLKTPRFTTPGLVINHLGAKRDVETSGIGLDLMSGARDAVSALIDHLCTTCGLSPVDAYMLVSTCGDLRISEIVDICPTGSSPFTSPRPCSNSRRLVETRGNLLLPRGHALWSDGLWALPYPPNALVDFWMP